MVNYRCPRCDAPCESPDGLIGGREICPACRTYIRVPHPLTLDGDGRDARRRSPPSSAADRPPPAPRRGLFGPVGLVLLVLSFVPAVIFAVAIWCDHEDLAIWASAAMLLPVGLALALLPGAVAAARGTRSARSIRTMGLIGFFLFGFPWIVALCWAFMDSPADRAPTSGPPA